MHTVRMNSKALLSIVQKNRKRHHEEYKKAYAGYRKMAAEELREMAEEAELSDVPVRRCLTSKLPEPINNTGEYDQVIDMLKMSVAKVIELDQHQFRSYVRDEWVWRAAASVSNTMYFK